MSSDVVVCPKCKSLAIRRLARHSFWQRRVLPFFGRYPWECKICRSHFTLKKRGSRTRRRSESAEAQETHSAEA
jgi:hypothetical protein